MIVLDPLFGGVLRVTSLSLLYFHIIIKVGIYILACAGQSMQFTFPDDIANRMDKIDDLIFGKFSEKWQTMLNSLAELLEVPVALIFKKEEDRIRVVVKNDSERNPFDINDSIPIRGSFCHYVFNREDKFLVPDVNEIDLDINNVATQADFISYLGFPLYWPNGETFGTICLLDDSRNYFSATIEQFMQNFSEIINDNLKLIEVSYEMQRETREMYEQYQQFKGLIPICPKCKKFNIHDTWVPIENLSTEITTDMIDSITTICKKSHHLGN